MPFPTSNPTLGWLAMPRRNWTTVDPLTAAMIRPTGLRLEDKDKDAAGRPEKCKAVARAC
ncbi:hypothetical protein BV25DRAFT_1821309 [Artomyces pyxidatus]|uniref:Uncharacterized protein n=1 Tax=Artomyces pyxidatus TaxID=48021 RepID=A0ACB8TBZ1_9AGAM|nr:hypothetical protein BV25DRAFT_1821309 [Artomyces pyxidatus]